MIDVALSDHFTLREMIRTSVRSIDNMPPTDVIYRLTQLCNWVLEPIRERFGALRVNSGYRCPTLNKLIGGAPDSAHLYGCAADIEPAQDVPLGVIMEWLAHGNITFDQAIEEHAASSDWLHVGMLRPGREAMPRRQLLVMRDGEYTPWVSGH